MQKTIFITGATDGIGLETAKMLAAKGHNLLLHGRNPAKLEDVVSLLSTKPGDGRPGTYICDLSDMADVAEFAAGSSTSPRRPGHRWPRQPWLAGPDCPAILPMPEANWL